MELQHRDDDSASAMVVQTPDEEVDLRCLKAQISEINTQVEAAQRKVLLTIDAKHSEFGHALAQIKELRGEVEQLQESLRNARSTLGAQSSEHEGTVRLQGAISRHKAQREELDAIKCAIQVLTAIQDFQKECSSFDKHLEDGQCRCAAQCLGEMCRLLSSVSGPDGSPQPDIVKEAKLQYKRRRGLLVKWVEEMLARLIQFRPRGVTTRRRPSEHSGCTLEQVWESLQLLGVRDRAIEQLAGQLLRQLVGPILDHARQLSGDQELRPTRQDSQPDVAVWEFTVLGGAKTSQSPATGMENVGPNAQQASLQSEKHKDSTPLPRVNVQKVLPALESLLSYIQDCWSLGNEAIPVYQGIGKRLWPQLTKHLLKHFELFTDDGATLEDFELSMFNRGLISDKEKTLSKHIKNHRHAMDKHLRSSILGEVRDLLLSEDTTTVRVSDATEPGMLTQLGQEMLSGLQAPAPGGSQIPNCPIDPTVQEILSRVISDSDGFLRLPECCVSTTTHTLVQKLRGLMADVVNAVEQNNIQSARDLHKLCRELITLFAILRPHVHKAKLHSDPLCCAVFFNDCLYLVQVILLMPHSYGNKMSQGQQNNSLRLLAVFVDMVPMLRRLGETHFLNFMNNQKAALSSKLSQCSFGTISQDRSFVASEAAVGAAMQQLKSTIRSWTAVLPRSLLVETAGLQLGIVINILLDQVFKLQQMTHAEARAIGDFLSSVASTGSQLLPPSMDKDAIPRFVPKWEVFRLVVELLNADLQVFIERKSVLSQKLKREEITQLLQINPYIKKPAHEVLPMLCPQQRSAQDALAAMTF